MAAKKTKRRVQVKGFLLLFVAVIVALAALLRGKDVALFNAKGVIAQKESHLMIFTVVVLLVIAVPTLMLLYFFAWKYRESNPKARRATETQHGKFLAFSVWAIPGIVLLVLASSMIPATHELDPHKAIAASGKPPLTIQVIAMRWKWLFIYPQQDIATVNYVQVPVGTPVQFELTADDAPMNSFWIPHWGGQLYAMTGMVNQLNLMATTAGDYSGGAAEINGEGFAGMKFTARASLDQDFDQWVLGIRQSSDVLDSAQYNKLLTPSQNNPAAVYSGVQSDLYNTVVMKYGSHDHMGH
ncbi:MAG: Ubiquinol oxidase subunit 2 [Candidatus Saccharibacteria bacterium]|nr:Ubiquinol oxidase subunit 2 [Candidatus Saccharibacteria bacterium]